MSIPRAQPHAQPLFPFPIVFGINLIHFFDEKKNGSIVCFGDSIPCHVIWQKQNFVANDTYCFGECNVFGNGKSELGAIQEGRKRYKFLARKSAKLFANTKVHIFGKEKCKTHRQFQRYLGDVTSVSLSLSLSLSLSASAPHAQYRKRFRASYNQKFARLCMALSFWIADLPVWVGLCTVSKKKLKKRKKDQSR